MNSVEEPTNGELSLYGKGLKSLPNELTQKHGSSLTKLDLTGNEISSGKGFEGLTKLHTLILDKNSIKSLSDFPIMKSVETLWLNNNEISQLKPLMDVLEKNFPNLNYLSMLKNPACPNMYFSDGEAEAYQRYRYYVIFRLRSLRLLDALPVDANEQKEAQRVGKFMTIAKPVDEGNDKVEEDQPQAYKISSFNKPPKVGSFLGRGKPRYDGSNSEGNRFISNDEL